MYNINAPFVSSSDEHSVLISQGVTFFFHFSILLRLVIETLNPLEINSVFRLSCPLLTNWTAAALFLFLPHAEVTDMLIDYQGSFIIESEQGLSQTIMYEKLSFRYFYLQFLFQ